MSTYLSYPKFKAWDSSGNLLSGGKLYSYEPGSSTEKSTYTTKALTTANANPVILDSDGEADIFYTGVIKLVLKDSDDTTLWTFDNLPGHADEMYKYFPDAAQTDQGATSAGGNLTVRDFVDDLSTTKYGTIVLAHTGAANTTAYTFQTTEVINANITLEVQDGALITDDANNASITINGPIKAEPGQRVFDWGNGTGTLSVPNSPGVYLDWFATNTTPGTTDMSKALYTAIEAANGSAVFIGANTYKVSTMSSYTPTKDIVLRGVTNELSVLNGGGDQRIIVADATSFEATDITFSGWLDAIYQAASTSTKVDFCDVRKCVFTDCKAGILLAAQIGGAFVDGNLFHTFSEAGEVSGVRFGTDSVTNDDLTEKIIISNNIFTDLNSTDNDEESHAIFVFGHQTIITGNIIEDITNNNDGDDAEGIYTKSYYNIITNNIIIDAGSDEGAICCKGSPRVAPGTNRAYVTRIQDNIILYSSASSTKNGIFAKVQDLTITGNYIENANNAIIQNVENSSGDMLVAENKIYTFGEHGIYFMSGGGSVKILNNDICDSVSGEATIHGIRYTPQTTATNELFIQGNDIQLNDLAASATDMRGIRFSSATKDIDKVNISNNMVNVAHSSATLYGIYMACGGVDNLTVMGNDLLSLEGEGWDKPIFFGSDTRPTAYYHIKNNAGFPDESNIEVGFDGVLKATYNYTGGASGSVSVGDLYLPPNAIVTRAYYYVTTQPNSAGGTATVAIGIVTDDTDGLKAPVDEDDASWVAGWHDCIQDGPAADFAEKTTQPRSLQVRIANEALTAGLFTIFVEYIIDT